MTQRIVIERVEEKSAHHYCRELEMGNILFFPSIPFSFSECASDFLEDLLTPYSKGWRRGNFGSSQERKTLNIHTPSKEALHGKRVLQFLINLDPKESEHWITSLSFDALIKKYGGREVPFPESIGYSFLGLLERKMKRSFGMKRTLRSPYDIFMLQFHRFLKENEDFQATSLKAHWEFPPNSCWILFTDQVSYASLSNRSLLDFSFFIPTELLLYPERSPLHVLQRLSGNNLMDSVSFS